jgi:hypothetical protein
MSDEFGPLDLVPFQIVLVILLNASRSEPTTLTSNQPRLHRADDVSRQQFAKSRRAIRISSHRKIERR